MMLLSVIVLLCLLYGYWECSSKCYPLQWSTCLVHSYILYDMYVRSTLMLESAEHSFQDLSTTCHRFCQERFPLLLTRILPDIASIYLLPFVVCPVNSFISFLLIMQIQAFTAFCYCKSWRDIRLPTCWSTQFGYGRLLELHVSFFCRNGSGKPRNIIYGHLDIVPVDWLMIIFSKLRRVIKKYFNHYVFICQLE